LIISCEAYVILSNSSCVMINLIKTLLQ
jgi:hypothetical protein